MGYLGELPWRQLQDSFNLIGDMGVAGWAFGAEQCRIQPWDARARSRGVSRSCFSRFLVKSARSIGLLFPDCMDQSLVPSSTEIYSRTISRKLLLCSQPVLHVVALSSSAIFINFVSPLCNGCVALLPMSHFIY